MSGIDVTRGAAAKLDADNPWPGPEAFTREDAKFFFGRDRALDALTRLVLQGRLVLLYGRSGLGKTSLLRAGVFPKLEDALTLPIYIRLQFGPSLETGVAPDLLLQVRTAIEAAVSHAGAEAPPMDPAATLWEWFYRADARFFNERSRRVRPVLVFDQFEEAFTHGRATPALAASTDRFLDQLIDLIRGSVPVPVAARLEEDATRALEYVADRDACGVLLAVRREFLAEVLRLRPRLPALLDRRFELSGMTLEDAESVVVGAGQHLIEPGVEKLIARFVAAARRNVEDQSTDDTTVDPAILSIFCRELNNTRKQRNLPRITQDLVVGVQDEIIADFYRRSVADLPPPVRGFIEEQLVTPSGYRNSVAWDQAVREPGVEAAIAPLVDRRLIRVEGSPPRARIELTHDVLTEPIVQSRNVRRVQEATERARAEADRVRSEAAKEDQRRRERQALRNRGVTVAILAVLLGGVGVLAYKTYLAQAAAEKNLSFARVEQGLGLVAAGQTARGLAYIARELREHPDNLTARSLALDAVMHGNWALPQKTLFFDHGAAVAIVGVGPRDTMVLNFSDRNSHSNTQRLWRLDAPDATGTLDLGGSDVSAVAVGPTDDRLAVGTAGGTLRIGRTLTIPAHHGPIVQMAFDGSGERLVTASDDATAAVWNAATGVRLMLLTGHRGRVLMAQFSPDARSVVTASGDGRALVWDIRGKQPRIRLTLEHPSAVTVLAARFSPDGSRIITASDGDNSARVWDANTGRQLGTALVHDARLISAAFSPDGFRMMTATTGEVAIWTLDGTRAMEPIRFEGGLTSAVFTSDGRRMVTTAADGALTVWDVRSGAAVPNSVRAPCGLEAIVKFAADGHQVAVGCPDSGFVALWDPESNELRATESNAALVGLSAIDYSESTGRVAAINGGQVALSRIGTQDVTLLAHGSRVYSVAFSPDGRLIATAGDDGTAVWDAGTGAAITRVARGSDSWSVHFTQDSARILTSSRNGFAELWDARSGGRAGPAFRTMTEGARGDAPPDRFDARIDAAARRVVLTSAAGVTLFDAKTGATIANLDLPRLERPGASIAFSPAGDVLVTMTTVIQLWNAETGHLLATLREPSPPTDAQFTADGSRLVTTHIRGFRFWDARTGQPQTRLVPVSDYEGIASVATNGQHAVAVTGDGMLRDWDFPLATERDTAWIAPLLELMIGDRTTEWGAIEPIDKWSDALDAARRRQNRGSDIEAWALGDRDARTINPFTKVTPDEYIRRQLGSGSADALREAQHFFPWDRRIGNGVIR